MMIRFKYNTIQFAKRRHLRGLSSCLANNKDILNILNFGITLVYATRVAYGMRGYGTFERDRPCERGGGTCEAAKSVGS